VTPRDQLQELLDGLVRSSSFDPTPWAAWLYANGQDVLDVLSIVGLHTADQETFDRTLTEYAKALGRLTRA